MHWHFALKLTVASSEMDTTLRSTRSVANSWTGVAKMVFAMTVARSRYFIVLMRGGVFQLNLFGYENSRLSWQFVVD